MMFRVPIYGEDRRTKLLKLKKHSNEVIRAGTHKLLYWLSKLAYIVPVFKTNFWTMKSSCMGLCYMAAFPSLKNSKNFLSCPIQRMWVVPAQQVRELGKRYPKSL